MALELGRTQEVTELRLKPAEKRYAKCLAHGNFAGVCNSRNHRSGCYAIVIVRSICEESSRGRAQ